MRWQDICLLICDFVNFDLNWRYVCFMNWFRTFMCIHQILKLRSKDLNVFGINHFMDWNKQNYQSTILQCANFLQFHFDYLNWKQLCSTVGSVFSYFLFTLNQCVWIPVHFCTSMYCNNRIMEDKWCSDEKNIRVTLSMVIHIR